MGLKIDFDAIVLIYQYVLRGMLDLFMIGDVIGSQMQLNIVNHLGGA